MTKKMFFLDSDQQQWRTVIVDITTFDMCVYV